MYSNTGYLYQKDIDQEDTSRPLIVQSCGNYRLRTLPSFNTLRPFGRKDYQLLYVASGRVFCLQDGRKDEVEAGNVILFRPDVIQNYSYYREDKTEVYWVHFTGRDVAGILQTYSVFASGREEGRLQVVPAGLSSEYQFLFLQMIHELQIQEPCFEEMLLLLLKKILLLAERYHLEAPYSNSKTKKEMEEAVHYFNENFSTAINIEEYAKKQNMSTCWFIRKFKSYTGMPPMQYITKIRISKACGLLESTDYNVAEIGMIVGYENPLYFSRMFKRLTGCSPTQYRSLN